MVASNIYKTFIFFIFFHYSFYFILLAFDPFYKSCEQKETNKKTHSIET